MNEYNLKRPIDVAVSAVGILIASPVLAGIAVGVRFDSPGPALFRQQRIGMDKKSFEILKFRTMVDRPPEEIDQNAEEVISTSTDARVTRFGRILRSTSLDELPQLFNILKGDMSLVGPRPIIPAQLEALPAEQDARFGVKPGLTGLAQVTGRRSLDWLEQLAVDCEYVRQVNFREDVRILMKTIMVVANRTGVYGEAGSNWRMYIAKNQRESSGVSASRPTV